jgi:hypothetical protein
MRLFRCLQPQVVQVLSTAVSRIHVSFDGWTTKGGKRRFFSIVTHFADASRVIQDLPIDLPQLTGAYTGDAIAAVISKTLKAYSIILEKLGYFILNNAANNDTAIAALALEYNFNLICRRLRCGPYTLNLVRQAIIFSANIESYNNITVQLNTEIVYMQE